MHEPPSELVAKPTALEFVVQDVVHLDATLHFLEMMLVMPQGIRPKPLLVDEVRPVLTMGDFCDPCHGDVQQRTNAVPDDLT